MQSTETQLLYGAIRAVIDKIMALGRGRNSFHVKVMLLTVTVRIARGKILAREMVSKARSYAVRLLLNHRIQDYRNRYRSHIRRARQEYTLFRGRTKTEESPLRPRRMARCACGRTTHSRNSLCEFEYRGPGSPWAEQVCVCGYHRLAHHDAIKGKSASPALRGCPGFKPCGDAGHDVYWCGCETGRSGVYRAGQHDLTSLDVSLSPIANYRMALTRLWFKMSRSVVDPFEY